MPETGRPWPPRFISGRQRRPRAEGQRMIVMKFGGTSVADAGAMRQAAAIVAARRDRHPLVVVSAMAGVTDELVRVARAARERRGEEALRKIDGLRRRHLAAAGELAAARQGGPSGEL